MQELWHTAIQAIESRMAEQNFELWIRPLRFRSTASGTITLVAPNRYIKEWFEDNYRSIVLEEVQRQATEITEIEVVVEPTPQPTVEGAAPVPAAPLVSPARVNLNDRYRFGAFVVGPSNQFAAAAARLAAQIPGRKYNPLFIYGGTGLGKTHLLQAVGHAILDANPTWNVVYASSERFLNEYIASIRLNRTEEFRTKYRREPDVLLVDDIQFLAGKDRTQIEFFHTFNALHEAKKQIVITADKFPHQMPDIEDRLKSRFQWGLIVDILVPELETRVAILQKKAETDGIPLPSEVAHYLASQIKSNVRELEGALIRLAAFASLQGQAITVDFAQQSLGEMLSRGREPLTIERIQREVAAYFNIKQKDLKSHRRPRAISYPRQIAMHLCRKLTASSLAEIGRHFGGKDHTTVLSADRKIRRLSTEDDSTRNALEALEQLLSR